MKRKLRAAALMGLTLLLVAGLCLLPAGLSRNNTADTAAAQAAPSDDSPGPQATPATAREDATPAAQAASSRPSPAPGSANAAVTQPLAPQEPQEPGEPAAGPAGGPPDGPPSQEEMREVAELIKGGAAPEVTYAAAIDYASQAPGNFAVAYTVSSHTAACSWNAVTNPVPAGYRVYKWSLAGSYGTVELVYYLLTWIEPSALPYYEDWYSRINTSLSGMTYTEKQEVLDGVEASADALNGILCASGSGWAPTLLAYLVGSAVATRDNGTSTTWNDTNCANNNVYWYAAVTLDGSGAVSSPLSHTEYIFAVTSDSSRPATPTGVTAMAYDPGVFVEWSRNTDVDLAGYNVYRQSGSNWIKLNASLITTGTEYYYADGVAGQVYAVRAVDMSGNESRRSASATAVLQPATTYLATDAGWSTTGTWKAELYTLLPPPDTGPADLLVAQDAGAVAGHAFTGRRVRLYVSTYWSCGSAEVLIDGQVQATVSMSGAETPSWGVSAFTISGLSKGSHTFALRCLGSGGSQGYNFVNLQYIEVR